MNIIRSTQQAGETLEWNAAAFKGFFDYLKSKNAKVLFSFGVNDTNGIEIVTVQGFPIDKVKELLRECLAEMEKAPPVVN